MRAVAVHPDVLVITSRLWQTNAVVLRGRTAPAADSPLQLVQAGPGAEEPAAGAEAMLIDSPYFPDELEALPQLLAQTGFAPVTALLATHADFDHLLGRFAFPSLALGVGEPTALRLRADPGVAQRDLRAADADHYVVRPAPLRLGDWQALPVPGRLEVGGEEVELHPAEGHTADGTAFHAPHAGLLVVGDFLSDVEIPMISPGGSLAEYRLTLARLAPLVEGARTVVPGHGGAHDRDSALRILDEDLTYLDALEAGQEQVRLPAGRDSRRQRAIHAQNLERV